MNSFCVFSFLLRLLEHGGGEKQDGIVMLLLSFFAGVFQLEVERVGWGRTIRFRWIGREMKLVVCLAPNDRLSVWT